MSLEYSNILVFCKGLLMHTTLKYLFFLILFTTSSFCFSQNQIVDSLEAELYSEPIPEKQIDILGELYVETKNFDRKKALFIAKEILFIAQKKAKKDIVYANNLVGIAFMDLEQNDSALHYYQTGLDIAIEKKDSLYMSKIYTNIGAIQFYMGDLDKGFEYMQKSADIEMEMGNLEGATISYLNMGAIYLQLEDYENARGSLEQSIQFGDYIDDKENLVDAYYNLAILEMKLDNTKEGEKLFFKCLEIYEEMGDYVGVSDVYRGLAHSFQKQNDYHTAIVYDKKSLEYALKIDNASSVVYAYSGLAQSYEELGNYRMAFENIREQSAWEDTLQSRENRNRLIEMQEKYNSEQTAKENEILTQKALITDLELVNNQKELTKSRIIIWSSIFGLALLVILAFTLYNRNVIKQKANLQLQEANDIINEKNQDITSSLHYASKIQEALLPVKENLGMFTDSFIMLKPKDIVSGDFYWYSEVEGKKIIAAVDCTGHGVPGAFMSMIGNTFLHEIINEKKIITPGTILNELREKVISAMDQNGMDGSRRDGMDMSLCMIDETSNTLEFAGANNPIYLVQDEKIVEIKGDKKPVGYMPEKSDDFTNHSVKVNTGDIIYLFSDGYADQFGGSKGKKFKYKQFRELLLANCQKSMQDQKEILSNRFVEWKGQLEQIDDVCVIGIKI